MSDEPTPLDSVAPEADREPWLAATWSAILPGLGHLYLGSPRMAAVWIAAVIVGTALACGFLLHPALPVWPSYVLLPALVLVWLGAIVHAYADGRRSSIPTEATAPAPGRRAPLGVFLNHLLPGLGHLVLRRWGAGVVLVLLFLLTSALPRPWERVAWGLLSAVAMWHVWRAVRSPEVAWPQPVTLMAVVQLAVAIATAIVLATLRLHALQAFRVPSASMEPALQVGDFLYVEKVDRMTAKPGEIVVIPYPNDRSKPFLKRVLGAPGDVVEFRADGAYRNGERVLESLTTPDQAGWTGRSDVLGGTGRPFRVPDGHVFVIGDQLGNSNDSRFFGPIPLSDVAGRAYRIYWPPARAGTIPSSFPPGSAHARTPDHS
jgi:signal peptidase I